MKLVKIVTYPAGVTPDEMINGDGAEYKYVVYDDSNQVLAETKNQRIALMIMNQYKADQDDQAERTQQKESK